MDQTECIYIRISNAIYILEGGIMFVANMLFVYVILQTKTLYLKYGILLALFFVNGCMGFALLTCGIGRLEITFEHDGTLRSRRQCAMVIWNLIGTWVEPCSAAVMMIMSIDRLLCIIFPLSYYRKTARYQYCQILIWAGLLLPLFITNWILVWPEDTPLYSPMCWTDEATNPFFNQFFNTFRVVITFMSIILYVIVYKMSKRHWAIQKQQRHDSLMLKRQRRLTLTVGATCITTVIFYVVPVILLMALNLFPLAYHDYITTYASASANLNSVSMIVVVAWRQREITDALLKRLPWCSILFCHPRYVSRKFVRTKPTVSVMPSDPNAVSPIGWIKVENP